MQVSKPIRNASYVALAQTGKLKVEGNKVYFPDWDSVLFLFLNTPSENPDHNGANVQSTYNPEVDGTPDDWRENRSNGSGTMFLRDALERYLDSSEFKNGDAVVDGKTYAQAKKINLSVSSAESYKTLIDKLESSKDLVSHGEYWQVPTGCKPGGKGRKSTPVPSLTALVAKMETAKKRK